MLQNEFMGGVAVKTMQVSNFYQSDIIISFQIVAEKIVV